MSSLGLLEAKIIQKWRTTGNYCHGCYFCGIDSGLVVGVGALVVGGGCFWGHWGGVCTGDGFHRSYADLTPWIGLLCPRSTILTTMQPAVAGTQESPRHIWNCCIVLGFDFEFVQLCLAQLLQPWVTPLILIPRHIWNKSNFFSRQI